MQVRRWRPALVLAAALAVVGAGSAQAATWSVGAGPPLKKAPPGLSENITANAFFPKTLKIHAGDKVSFGVYGFHTITFLGTKSRPPLAAKYPGTVSGINDQAGNPFWFNGQPIYDISSAVAAATKQKSISSRKDFRSSGLPNGPPKPYVLKFKKAGTYKFLCLIHPALMKGTIKVLPRGRRVLSKSKVAKAVKKQANTAIAQARKIQAGTGPTGNVIDAGEGNKAGVADNSFFPANKSVPVGTTIHFQVGSPTEEPHTVTFGPQDFLATLANSAFSNPGAGDAIDVYPSDPPGQVVVNGTTHGNGFANSGYLDRDPKTSQPSGFDIKFTAPGSFYYLCLIHGPSMSGTITVTP